MYLIILNTNIQMKYGVIIMYNVVKSNTSKIKNKHTVTVHTRGTNEEHADEDETQNHSL